MSREQARVHELAKEFGISSQQVLSKLQDLGVYVKSPGDRVEPAVVHQLREMLNGKEPARKPPPKPGPRRPSAPQRIPADTLGYSTSTATIKVGSQTSIAQQPSDPKTAPRRVFGIFISYRRSDEAAFAGRIFDKLETAFGPGHIFMDVDSIELGRDFVEALDEALAVCSAMVVVIGKSWLNAQDHNGVQRLSDPSDFVRLEIEAGLSRNIRIIPILVEEARMPHSVDLPPSMGALARRNGRSMSNARFGADSIEVISTLKRILGLSEP